MFSKMYQYYSNSTNHYRNCDRQNVIFHQWHSRMNGMLDKRNTTTPNDWEAEGERNHFKFKLNIDFVSHLNLQPVSINVP